jgi:hypothetical protein
MLPASEQTYSATTITEPLYKSAYTPLGQGTPIPTVVTITPSAPSNEMMQPDETPTLNKSGNSQLYPNLTAKLAVLTSLRKPTSDRSTRQQEKIETEMYRLTHRMQLCGRIRNGVGRLMQLQLGSCNWNKVKKALIKSNSKLILNSSAKYPIKNYTPI